MFTLMQIASVTFLQPLLRFKLFLVSQLLDNKNRSYNQNDEWHHHERT